MLKYNWKRKTWKVFLGCRGLSPQTGILVFQTAWMHHCWINNQHQLSNSFTKEGVSCQSLMEVIQTGKKMKTAKDSQFIKFNTNWKNIKTLSSKRNSFQKVELQKKKRKKKKWNSIFNHDPRKQAQEVIFSRKIKRLTNPNAFFNATVTCSSSQKHLGMYLDENLKF